MKLIPVGLLMGLFNLSGILHAQDTIYLKNGRQPLPVKIDFVKNGRVKYFLPQKKNGRMITVRFIDSVKYADGSLDEKVERYNLKAINAANAQEQRRELAKLKNQQHWAARRARNSFNDPYPNRLSTGAQAIATSVFFVKVLVHSADISAALGTNLAYERSLLKSRWGVTASGFWSWNKTAEGLMLGARYYALNRSNFRIGIGPAFAYTVMDYKEKRSKRQTYIYDDISTQQVAKPATIKAHASSYTANFTAQVNLGKRTFVANDLFIGGSNYRHIDADKAFFAYRLNLGFKF